MMTIFIIGIVKGILSYQGKSTSPTTLDWVGGALLAALLYWVGLYEQADAKKWKWVTWVLEVDLAPAIGYSLMRAIGTFTSVLLYRKGLIGLLGYLLLGGSLNSFIFTYIIRTPTQLSVGAAFGILAGLSFGVAIPFSLVAFLKIRNVQVGVSHCQRAQDFVNKYGLYAPLEEGYMGWFGAVGMIVGTLSLIPIFWSPIAALIFGVVYK
ncbi:hypothetical protein V8E53_003871 [Lactarius tabidus]